MNEKERIAKMMSFANSIATHANEANYVRSMAEAMQADLFCESIKNGEKAYIRGTEQGLVYTMETDFGSYTLPMQVVNERLLSGNMESSKMGLSDEAPEQTEKKTNLVESEHLICETDPICMNKDDGFVEPATDSETDVPVENANQSFDSLETQGSMDTPKDSVADAAESYDSIEDNQSIASEQDVTDNSISSSESASEKTTQTTINNHADKKWGFLRNPFLMHVKADNEASVAGNENQSDSFMIDEYEKQMDEENVTETKANEKIPYSSDNHAQGFHAFDASRINDVSETELRKPGRYANLTESSASEGTEFCYKNDGGELYKHTHNLKVVLAYNTENVCGNYQVELWPTWIQYNTNTKTFAECLVRLTNDKGEEHVAVIDKNNREVYYKFKGDDYTFKVFGIWQAGMLITNVILDNASKYKLFDEVEKEEPENLDHNFLNQFKNAEKGQPSYFIVPLRNNNRGEKNVPIIGTATAEGGKFILARVNGNTCRYNYNGRERIISGHWEAGHFKINIE